jgi:hypothetical protein
VTTPPDPIRKIRRHRAKIFASAKAQGILAEGLDAADIGINSIVDFGKFTKHN